MPKLRDAAEITQRIYPRRRGAKDPRSYGDFRDYAAVGGGQEPLVPEGCRYATNDLDEAKKLAEARLEELKAKRVDRPAGPASKRRLEVVIPDHLSRKAKLAEGGEQWLGNVQVHLTTFAEYFVCVVTSRTSRLGRWRTTGPTCRDYRTDGAGRSAVDPSPNTSTPRPICTNGLSQTGC